MSDITTAFVNQFRSNLDLALQQHGSRLRPFVRNEAQNAEYSYYDRIGAVEAVEKTTRHGDTPILDTPYVRRRNGLRAFEWADLIDKEDRVKMLAEPGNAYATSAASALGRKIDELIIEAATGTAYAGKTGGTSVALPGAQTVAVDYVESGSATNSNLTLAKLRAARHKLLSAEAIRDGQQVVCVITSSQLMALLRTVEATSADYNVVRALVNGSLDSFMGFKFVVTQLLAKSGNNRSALVFTPEAIVLGVADNITVKIDQRSDKSYATQVYASLQCGASRLWEEAVVEILCDETK